MINFTPSEIVVLFPDVFADDIGIFTRTIRLADGREVASASLGIAAAQAAMLANREAKAVRLNVRERSALFGLVTSRRVVAAAAGGTVPWPSGTLEAAVAERVPGSGVEVTSLFRDIIEVDRIDPWAWLVSRVEAGLATRGLLTAEQIRRLLIFSAVRFSLPAPTRDAANAVGPAHTRALLHRTEVEEPTLWKCLDRSLRSAVALRTATSD